MYTVVKGKKIGHKIGFPTINLEPTQMDVDFGVYACEVYLHSFGVFEGVLHYGKRETTDGKVTLEIYIFDFDKEIYGEKVKISVGKKIRENHKFKNLEELKRQIELDIQKIKKHL